jgi:DNA-binding NtrC family response regulator
MATILIVDDSDLTLDRVRAVLERAGHRVVTVNSPFGTSAAIVREKPDLVLIDVAMPALSGDVLVSIARRRTASEATKIVLHSGRSVVELSATATACGANGFIQKTADPVAFLHQVEGFLASAAKADSNLAGWSKSTERKSVPPAAAELKTGRSKAIEPRSDPGSPPEPKTGRSKAIERKSRPPKANQ